jgi:hypothetical protein
LKKESRFADLMIIGSEKFFEQNGDKDRYEHLRDLLHVSECPVLLVPEDFEFPKCNLLAYDGSASSVKAIKQFSYLFPEWRRNETVLVFAGRNEELIPEKIAITELLAGDFPSLKIRKLDPESEKYRESFACGNEHCILVCGAFGRSLISEMFHKSFAAGFIMKSRMPVFISHF